MPEQPDGGVHPIRLNGLQVVVTPDEVRQTGDGIRVRRIRTGQMKSDEKDGFVYPLYIRAAEQHFGPAAVVEVVHLTDQTRTPIDYNAGTVSRRMEKIEGLATALLGGYFPPEQNDRVCPTCPHFFICAAVPPGRLMLN